MTARDEMIIPRQEKGVKTNLDKLDRDYAELLEFVTISRK